MRRFTWFNATSIALGFAFLYIPILLLVIYSFNESKLVTVWGGWSTKWYGELLKNEGILSAAWVTLRVAVVSSTLPGARLFHEGQFDGRRVRLPVFLARRPGEPTDADLRQFYDRLLGASRGAIFREGRWRLCERSGWPDNASCLSLVAWTWEHGDERFLIVVNLSDRAAQAHVAVDWGGVAGGTWRLHDRLTGHTYDRTGDDLASGLYVDLGPWDSHLFQCEKRKLQ